MAYGAALADLANGGWRGGPLDLGPGTVGQVSAAPIGRGSCASVPSSTAAGSSSSTRSSSPP